MRRKSSHFDCARSQESAVDWNAETKSPLWSEENGEVNYEAVEAAMQQASTQAILTPTPRDVSGRLRGIMELD